MIYAIFDYYAAFSNVSDDMRGSIFAISQLGYSQMVEDLELTTYC